MNRPVFIILFLLLLCGSLNGQGHFPRNISWEEINGQNLLDVKLDLLEEKATYFLLFKDKPEKADSICEQTLELVVKSQSKKHLIKGLNIYFNYSEISIADSSVLKIIEHLKIDSDPLVKWHGYMLAARFYDKIFDYQNGVVEAKEAVRLTENLSDSTKKGESYLIYGANLTGISRKLEGLNYFLKARDIFKKYNDLSNLSRLNEQLFYFYMGANLYDDCRGTIAEEFELIKQTKPFDSLRYYLEIFRLDYANYSDPNIPYDKEYLLGKIVNAVEKDFGFLKKSYLAIYRTRIIEDNDFKALYELYTELLPDDFEKVKQYEKPLYYRLKAYFKEYLGDLDSANYYWIRTLSYFDETSSPVYFSNYLYRFAQFLERTNNQSLAIDYYLEAKDKALQANNLEFQLRPIKELERIYRENGEFKKAYQEQEKRNLLEREIDRVNERDKLVLTEFLHDAQAKQSQQISQIKSQEFRIKAFGVGFGIFLVLSGLFFYQYRQTTKEKKRSDDLLLNILPESTANELKEKGHTTALKYEHVTILFADIVGFTNVAEKLSPAELVQEIDRFFSAFDEIILKHRLEKIKTIGDAYMAVGGCPEGNVATTKNVVEAGIAMQKKVAELNERNTENHQFKLRIGLHTGDVIAGVVGIKKFQFDIWGDAVNIAARMEQHGEPGKVNISQATYEMVKSDFNCTYRGKIDAKNKGMLDMYFVNT